MKMKTVLYLPAEEEAGEAEKDEDEDGLPSLYAEKRLVGLEEDEDGVLSLPAEEEAGEAEKKEEDEDGLHSLPAEQAGGW